MYLYRAKRRGEHCIGCPHAKLCAGKKCNSGTRAYQRSED